MTRYFCTYFDKNFLLKGVALYNSLLEHCSDFVLYVLCFDDETYNLLRKMGLKNMELIRLADFEDGELLAAKKTRSIVEYYWTCTPSLPLYILRNHPGIDMITYLDADMYFYASPEVVFQEMGDGSVMIIPHRFSETKKDKEKLAGTYNVGMLSFKNNPDALECLTWWREKCIGWCYARYEDGKFGDQTYLNDWPTRFKNVYVLKNEGVNVGSWNIERYQALRKVNPLVLYHFHGLKVYLPIKFYPVQILDSKIYKIYRDGLRKAYQAILASDPDWDYGFAVHPGVLRLIKQHVVKSLRM